MKKFSYIYSRLQAGKKKLLIRTFIYAALLLGINTYAWFIYFNKFDGNINANVVGWDVSFYDEETSMDSVSIDINQLYPGMSNYEKEITVNNKSDVEASFSYEIVNFQLFGETIEISDTLNSEELINMLSTYFPFSINFSQDKDLIAAQGDSAKFNISVTWPFESENKYYKLNEYVTYDSSVKYYIYSNDNYVETSVTASNFESKVDSGLYMESDDADSYWGERASKFKALNSDDPCLSLKLNLNVTQTK